MSKPEEDASPRVLIVGAGGHGRSVAEALEALGDVAVVGFVDDGWPKVSAVWYGGRVGAMLKIG